MRLLPVLTLALTVLALAVPFINQPFNQDDRDFVTFARVSSNKLVGIVIHNYSYDGRFFKNYHDPHGPFLTTYLGTFLRAGAGESAALFHGLYLIFPLIGAVSMYFLGRRFTGHPLIAALLLMFTPGFLVLSHTLMDDAPGLSLALATAVLYIYGADRKDGRLLIFSGVAMIFAALTAYQTLSLVPALLFYGFLCNDRGLKRFLPFVLLAAAGIAWLLITYKIYGRLPAVSYKFRGQDYQWPGFSDAGLKPNAILVSLAGAAIFPLSVLFLFLRGKKNLAVAVAALGASVALVFFSNRAALDGSLLRSIQVILLTFTGVVIVYKVVVSGAAFFVRKDAASRNGLFLLAWFASTLGIYLLILVPYVSVRHLLLTFPPVILLFVREFDTLWIKHKHWRRSFIITTLFFTLAAGLVASISDYRSASVYPAVAQQLGQQYGRQNQLGRNVYFRGEFGFRYYLEQQGFKELTNETKLRTGDLVIFSTLAGPATPWPRASYNEILRIEPVDSFPFRIWNYWAGAGFYTNRMGPLPIVFSDAIQDRIIVYQVHV